jgi:hypothetical protein
MTRRLKPDTCSPTRRKYRWNDTPSCYSEKDLAKAAELWDNGHAQKVGSRDPATVWKYLADHIPDCDRESCWASKLSMPTGMFAPTMPASWKKNKNEWLSSVEIKKLMKLYEADFPNFAFLGPSPSNFFFKNRNEQPCVWPELCQFDLHDYVRRGKTRIGVIFNLDPHNKPGSHWVSMFINTDTKRIYYFDSTGETIPKNIAKFKDKVMRQSNNTYVYEENHPVEHQFGDTECGMYALFFISTMLRHDAPETAGEKEKHAALVTQIKTTLQKGGRRRSRKQSGGSLFQNLFKNKDTQFADKLMENLRGHYFNQT